MIIVDVSEKAFSSAVAVLKDGGVVAFPTETYYGLGVNPFDIKAVKRLYEIKNRAFGKPVLVLVENIQQAEVIAAAPLPSSFYRLVELFWPGALTLVCAGGRGIPEQLTGGSGTLAMRHSPHPVAQKLVALFGSPITATSANISGKKPAVSAQEVADYFADTIDLIIDGGTTPGTLASTLVKCNPDGIECLREGVLAFSEVTALYKTLPDQ